MNDPTPAYDPSDDPEYLAWCAAQERMCHRGYSTGGHDPYGTECDLDRGHAGPHQGADPMGGPGRIEWTGGGSIAGDPVPCRNVRRLP